MKIDVTRWPSNHPPKPKELQIKTSCKPFGSSPAPSPERYSALLEAEVFEDFDLRGAAFLTVRFTDDEVLGVAESFARTSPRKGLELAKRILEVSIAEQTKRDAERSK